MSAPASTVAAGASASAAAGSKFDSGLVFQTPVPSDIAIAQSVRPQAIHEVAAGLGLEWQRDLDLYGSHKAKVHLDVLKRFPPEQKDGNYIVVTGINPTPLGEGKVSNEEQTIA